MSNGLNEGRRPRAAHPDRIAARWPEPEMPQ